MQYGAFSLQAIAAHPGGTGPAQDTAGRAGRGSAGASDPPGWRKIRCPHDPPPTIKRLLSEEAPRCRNDPPSPQPSHPSRNRRAKAAAPPSLHDDVVKALQTLGLALAPGALDAALSAAEKESLSHLQFLHRLLAGPAEAKLARALERRIRAAGFRELTTLEGFDWEFNAQGVDRRSIEQLATCDFVRRHENVIFAGQSGLGKSRIIQSLGLHSVHPGLPGAVPDQLQAASGVHRGNGRRVT